MSCEVCLYQRPPKGRYLLRTFNISEEEIKSRLSGFSFSYSVSLAGFDLIFEKEEEWEKARKLLEDFVYTDRSENIEETLGRVLREKGLTLSTAESCTAGLLSARIVNVPGSSEYFIGGFVVYSNELKENFLCVNKDTLKRFGAVSWQTCLEMSMGLKKALNTDCGIAITGIAGPGGTPKKPEGLTYIGIFVKNKITIIKRTFNKGRNGNRFLSTQTAFFYLLKLLKKFA